MRKELVFVLLALFLCAGCNGNKKKMNGEHDLDAANITLDDHTISFYYNWYGNPSVDGEMSLMENAPVLKSMQRDRKSTRLNSSHIQKSRMPSSA